MSDPPVGAERPQEPRGAGETPSSYLRLPWYVVTAALVLVLGVALAVGLYASRGSRSPAAAAPMAPPIIATPAIAVPTAVSATSTPVAVLVTPTSAPAIATLASMTVAAIELATSTSVAAAPPAATPTLPSPAVTEGSTVLPTVEPTLAAEVAAGYERYWQVRSQALLDLDKTHLIEAMGGDHLASTARLIDELQSENRAIKTVVDHDYQVVQAHNESAQVIDDYLSNSFYVEPGTLKPISDPSSDELKVLYKMVRIDGVWKVVDSVRAE